MTTSFGLARLHDELVLAELARRRRVRLVLREDVEWIAEIDRDPHQLIDSMVEHGQLHRVARGQYVVAPAGTEYIEQAVPDELLVDMALREGYYVGYFSALIEYALTDMHSNRMYVAISQEHPKARYASLTLATETTVALVRQRPAQWPADLVRVRTMAGEKEFYCRSSIERTLVDCLQRPVQAAGIETVALAWRRAIDPEGIGEDISLGCIIDHAALYGDSALRRCAYMFDRLGLTDEADEALGRARTRSNDVLLDAQSTYGMSRAEARRDARTGIVRNVPVGYLEGWLAGEIG